MILLFKILGVILGIMLFLAAIMWVVLAVGAGISSREENEDELNDKHY